MVDLSADRQSDARESPDEPYSDWTDEDIARANLSASAADRLGRRDSVPTVWLSGPEFLFFRHVSRTVLTEGPTARSGDEVRLLYWGYSGHLGWLCRRFPRHEDWHATVLEHRMTIRHAVRGLVGGNVGIPLSFVSKSNGTINQAEVAHYLEWPVRFELTYDMVVVSPDGLSPDNCLLQLPAVLRSPGIALSLRRPGDGPGPSLFDAAGIRAWDVPGTRWLVYTSGDPTIVSEYRYRPPPVWPYRMTPAAWLAGSGPSRADSPAGVDADGDDEEE